MVRPVDGRVVVVAVVVLAAGAGAVVLLDDGDDIAPVDAVPAADAVVVVDGAFVTDPTTGRIANATLDRAGVRYRYEGLLDAAERRVGLRPDRVRWVTAFARYPDRGRLDPSVTDGYAGVVLEADWQEGTIADSARGEEVDLEERSYAGRSVYRLNQPAAPDVYLAVLAPNTYALSTTERVVQDAIDAADGGGLAATLRSALADRRDDAVVRAAGRVPTDALAGVADGVETVGTVDRVSVGYTPSNDTHLDVRLSLYAADRDAAEDLRGLLNAGRLAFAPRVDDPTVADALADMTVSRSEARVDVTYRDDVEAVIALGETAADRLLDVTGPLSDARVVPLPRHHG